MYIQLLGPVINAKGTVVDITEDFYLMNYVGR